MLVAEAEIEEWHTQEQNLQARIVGCQGIGYMTSASSSTNSCSPALPTLKKKSTVYNP